MLGKLLNRLEESFLCLLLVSMTLLVFAEVVARFGFNAGIHWAQEVTLTMMAWFVLFGASYGVKVGSHIGVDVFVKMLPRHIHRGVTMVAIVLCLFYCALFLYGSWVYIAKLHMVGIEMQDLAIQRWIPTSVLFIGFSMLVVRFLVLLWGVITHKTDGFHLADEAKDSMHIADEIKAMNQQGESK